MLDPLGRSTLPGPPLAFAGLRCPAPTVPGLVVPPVLTAGQAAFLVGLGPDQRRWLKRWPRTRAMLVAWYRNGRDPVIAAEVARLLDPKAIRRAQRVGSGRRGVRRPAASVSKGGRDA